MRGMLWAFLGAVLLLTACGAMSQDIVLPDPEDVARVTITGESVPVSSGNEAFISRLLQTMGTAKSTGKASVQDVPSGGAWLTRIDFTFKEGGSSTVFLYAKGGKLLLEQPYQGIYETDGSLRELLREVES